MHHIRTKTINETYVTCDSCGRKMLPNDPDCEYQERIAVRFRAGYGSVFGDGGLVEADLCQHCVKAVLGVYFRVTPDDSFEPKHESNGEPRKAFQEYQLRKVLMEEEQRRALWEALRVRWPLR